MLVIVTGLVLAAPAAHAQGFGRNKVQYRTFQFRVLATEHFDVYYYPEEEPAAQMIGRMPIAAFGNSDGDFQMLEYTTSAAGKRFALIVHHTDAEREWAYDRGSHVGKLERGLDEASARGWVLADMKADWKVIYPSR